MPHQTMEIEPHYGGLDPERKQAFCMTIDRENPETGVMERIPQCRGCDYRETGERTFHKHGQRITKKWRACPDSARFLGLLAVLLLLPGAQALSVDATLDGQVLVHSPVDVAFYLDGEESFTGNGTQILSAAPGLHAWNATTPTGNASGAVYVVDITTQFQAWIQDLAGDVQDMDADVARALAEIAQNRDAIQDIEIPSNLARKSDTAGLLTASTWQEWANLQPDPEELESSIDAQADAVTGQADDLRAMNVALGFAAFVAVAILIVQGVQWWRLNDRFRQADHFHRVGSAYFIASARVWGLEGSTELDDAFARVGLPTTSKRIEAVDDALEEEGGRRRV